MTPQEHPPGTYDNLNKECTSQEMDEAINKMAVKAAGQTGTTLPLQMCNNSIQILRHAKDMDEWNNHSNSKRTNPPEKPRFNQHTTNRTTGNSSKTK